MYEEGPHGCSGFAFLSSFVPHDGLNDRFSDIWSFALDTRNSFNTMASSQEESWATRRQKHQAAQDAIPVKDDIALIRRVMENKHSDYAKCWISLQWWMGEDALKSDYQAIGVSEDALYYAIARLKRKLNWKEFDSPDEARVHAEENCGFCKNR